MISGKKVLVVDDDKDVADLLQCFVTRMGHETRTAGDGMDAMGVYREFRPDAVVLDVIMPKMDCVEFLTWLGKDFPNESVILITSGYPGDYIDSIRILSEGLGAGKSRFLPKPLGFEAFRSALDELLAE